MSRAILTRLRTGFKQCSLSMNLLALTVNNHLACGPSYEKLVCIVFLWLTLPDYLEKNSGSFPFVSDKPQFLELVTLHSKPSCIMSGFLFFLFPFLPYRACDPLSWFPWHQILWHLQLLHELLRVWPCEAWDSTEFCCPSWLSFDDNLLET
jgi:hypothetical protein